MSRVFAIVGPSGVGKDTVMRAVAARLPNVHLVRRVITRAGAMEGEDYEPVTEAEFAARRARGDFALDWRAHGLSYGIPVTIHAALADRRPVLFNASRAVLGEAARVFPALTVVSLTARPEVLAERLAERGRETSAEIEERLARADLALPDGLKMVEIDNSGPLEEAVNAVARLLQAKSE